MKKGLLNKASEQCQAVLKLQPDNSLAHFNLGVVYTRQKLIEKAAAELEAAVRINPYDQRFQKGLEAFNEYKEALRRAEGKNKGPVPYRRSSDNNSR